MARVYNFTSASNDFKGDIIYYYDDVDMGTNTHSDAALQVKDENGLWTSYTDEDTNDYQITYSFTSPIKIAGLTGSALSTALLIETIDKIFSITIYPNPVTSQLQIDYVGKLKTIVYDFLGKQLLSTQLKTINMNTLPIGVYIIQTTDLDTNETNSYKIIKK